MEVDEEADFTTIEYYGLDDPEDVDLTQCMISEFPFFYFQDKFVKRTPIRSSPTQPNEIFVSHYSNPSAIGKKAQKILISEQLLFVKILN